MKRDNDVLVIGADGLLGSHLVRRLIEHDHSVRVLVHPQSRSPTLDGLPVQVTRADLLSDDECLERAVRGCRHVFHCAAITDPWSSPELTWKVNLEGTRKVIVACLAMGIERLVFTGSASTFQFGPPERPGDESGSFPQQYRGIAYMESKHAATRLVLDAVRQRGLDAVVVAPTFLLGDLDWRPSSGELIRQFIKRRLLFTSPGGRSFACAADVAEALLAAAERGRRGECYIAGGRNLSYLEFFGLVARIAGGVRPPRVVLPASVVVASGAVGSLVGRLASRKPALDLMTARLSIHGSYYSSAKAIGELGMPQTATEIAIEQSIRSLRNYGHL